MNVIVDVQGFKNELNQFIPKEIAILWKSRLLVLLIKPPYPFYELTKKERLEVASIEKTRGIYWNEGVVPYSNYKDCINYYLNKKCCILTKGYEKMLWIKEMFKNDNLFNLEDIHCPSFLTLYEKYTSSNIVSCIHHDKICALKNVFFLDKWCRENNVLTSLSI